MSTGFTPPGIPPLCQLMGCGWVVCMWHAGAGGLNPPVMGPVATSLTPESLSPLNGVRGSSQLRERSRPPNQPLSYRRPSRASAIAQRPSRTQATHDSRTSCKTFLALRLTAGQLRKSWTRAALISSEEWPVARMFACMEAATCALASAVSSGGLAGVARSRRGRRWWCGWRRLLISRITGPLEVRQTPRPDGMRLAGCSCCPTSGPLQAARARSTGLNYQCAMPRTKPL
jgi:hypothetical protein